MPVHTTVPALSAAQHAAAPAIPAVRVAGLRKHYGLRPVLDAVNLEIATGEAFGLVGLNGAGKTTLIKCLLDLSRPSAGTIELFGVSSREPRARARLGFVPERFAPPEHLSAREFLRLMQSLAAQPYSEAQAVGMLEQLELEARILPRPVRELSKGMTQKLGLAACFLVARDLYLLDEPMSGLDPASRVAVKSTLHRLSAQGRALFFTSHVLSDVEELCTSIAVLDQGVVRFRGAPSELCTRYKEPVLERAFLNCIRSHVQRHIPSTQ